jgi:hypothetical protein
MHMKIHLPIHIYNFTYCCIDNYTSIYIYKHTLICIYM